MSWGWAYTFGVFHVAAFYLFAELSELEAFRGRLVALGAECDVKGTILLAPEGVNGTIAGPREDVEAFLDLLRSDPRLSALEPKWSTAELDPFLRLKVRLSVRASVLIISVLASPGTPSRRQCPRLKSEIRSSSITSC